MHTEQQGIVVAVSPASALAARPRLFAALEAAFPVSFVAHGDGGPPPAAAALIAFAPDGRLPAREDLAHHGLPVLALHGDGDEDAGAEDVPAAEHAASTRACATSSSPAGWYGPRSTPTATRSWPSRTPARPGRPRRGPAPVHRVRAALGELDADEPLYALLSRARAGRGRPRPLPARGLGARRLAPAAAAGDDALRRPEPALAQLRLHRLPRAARARRRARLPRGDGDDPARRRAPEPRDGRAVPPSAPTASRWSSTATTTSRASCMAPEDAPARARAGGPGAAPRRALRAPLRPARRPRHDAAARHVLASTWRARSARLGFDALAAIYPRPWTDRFPAEPPLAGWRPGRLGRRLRRHPAHPAELERRRHRAARLPRPPDRPLRPPRGPRRRARAAGERPRRRSTAWATCSGCRWARSRATNGDRCARPANAPSCALRAAPARSRPSRARAPCRVQAPAEALGRRLAGGLVGRDGGPVRPFGSDVPRQGNADVDSACAARRISTRATCRAGLAPVAEAAAPGHRGARPPHAAARLGDALVGAAQPPRAGRAGPRAKAGRDSRPVRGPSWVPAYA